MSLDIPEMISAYKCSKCGSLFENRGNSKEAVVHCRKPVLELPAGFVLRRLERDRRFGFYIIGNQDEITQDHQARFKCFRYSLEGRFEGSGVDYPEAILRDIALGNYRFMTAIDSVQFDRFSRDLVKLEPPNGFITDPEGIPAFEKLLREAQEYHRHL